MSLFDAFVRDFFGADPLVHMRPTAPTGPRPGPTTVHRVTHMVEGLAGGNGSNTTRTFRQITYSSGSKSMNNISNLNNAARKNGNNIQNKQQQIVMASTASGNQPQSQKPLALTYHNSAPKPHNPDRGKRCSSVCEGWKRSLRNDKPECLLPAITKTERKLSEESKMRPTMVGVPAGSNPGAAAAATRRGSERYSRHSVTTAPTMASRKRSNSNCVSRVDVDQNLNKSYPGAKSRSRKGGGSGTPASQTEDNNLASSSSEDVSNLSSTLWAMFRICLSFPV